MRGVQARLHLGFYSGGKFDLPQIRKLDGELLELERSCARKDFRDTLNSPHFFLSGRSCFRPGRDGSLVDLNPRHAQSLGNC